MQKFDPTCGLSKNEIKTVKFNVKNLISRELPLLPDSVETKLFIEGRDAWMFRWYLLNEKHPISSDDKVSLEIVAILKKEFHPYQKKTHYKFTCNIRLQKDDRYHPKISIKEKTA